MSNIDFKITGDGIPLETKLSETFAVIKFAEMLQKMKVGQVIEWVIVKEKEVKV